MLDAAHDLFLGSSCVGCSGPGRMWCRECQRLMPTSAYVAWPTPTPAELLGPPPVTPWTSAPYDDPVRALVVGHKERGHFALRRPLAQLLATAVRAATAGSAGPWTLVPVPSRPGVVRQRGHDPLRRVLGLTARLLRHQGHDVLIAGLLSSSRTVLDQSGLGAAARAANLAGSMHVPSPGLSALAARRGRTHVVVCDDVLTTGSTAAEAVRALHAVGVGVSSIATIAATERRHPVPEAEGPLSWHPPKG